MKLLKSKKVNIAICLNGLMNMPPKDFPTMTEMEHTPEIIVKLKELIPEFVKSIEDGDKMNLGIITGKIRTEDIDRTRSEYYKVSTNLEKEKGDEIVNIEFENDEFNTFFQQFERWGRLWFIKLEAFLEFRKDLNTTNAQPKIKAENIKK